MGWFSFKHKFLEHLPHKPDLVVVCNQRFSIFFTFCFKKKGHEHWNSVIIDARTTLPQRYETAYTL